MPVQITETPNGLELRSTSWYEIDAKMRLYCGTHPNNMNMSRAFIEYEFIEDHIEQADEGKLFRRVPRVFEYVITLKKRKGIDK